MSASKSEYTPTTGEILTAVVTYRAIAGESTPPSIRDIATPDEAATYLAEFNRWRDNDRAEAQVEALRELAADARYAPDKMLDEHDITEIADRIAREAGIETGENSE